MQNENCFLLLVIKEAAVLFCTCQINHILILANIPQNPLSYAEFCTEIYTEKKGKKVLEQFTNIDLCAEMHLTSVKKEWE